MTDDERRMAAFNCAIDKTKQLITLSTGVLAIMISFGKDILKGAAPWTAILLLAAWVLFSISIVFGVQLLGRFAGRLQAAPLQPDTLGDPDIADRARYQV